MTINNIIRSLDELDDLNKIIKSKFLPEIKLLEEKSEIQKIIISIESELSGYKKDFEKMKSKVSFENFDEIKIIKDNIDSCNIRLDASKSRLSKIDEELLKCSHESNKCMSDISDKIESVKSEINDLLKMLDDQKLISREYPYASPEDVFQRFFR